MKTFLSILPLLFVFFQVNAQSSYKNLDAGEFTQMMRSAEDVIVLDVRTPQETAAGVIEGAVEINLYDPEFEKKVSALDKSKTYLVYCRSGRRSVTACKVMAEKGFSKLYNLKGGYNVWSSKR
jgi:rhodanese-related sulfurtransferase